MATTSARFGQVGRGTEGFSVVWDARGKQDIIRLVDKVTGNFLGGDFQRALAAVHEDAAIKIAQGMVDELDAKIRETGRRQTRGRRLQLALLDERNRDVTASSFIVGRESWLDQSPAELYWRQIEEGNNRTYDWRAFFTNDVAGGARYGPWSPGGTTSVSRNRQRRAGGEGTKLYSRRQPPGYKHSRMPQTSRGVLMNVGPFPAYRYSRGGSKVFLNYPFKTMYNKSLASYGLKMQ